MPRGSDDQPRKRMVCTAPRRLGGALNLTPLPLYGILATLRCGCSSVVESLLAKEKVVGSNLLAPPSSPDNARQQEAMDVPKGGTTMRGKRLSERTMSHAKLDMLIDYYLGDMERRGCTQDSVTTNRRALRRFRKHVDPAARQLP